MDRELCPECGCLLIYDTFYDDSGGERYYFYGYECQGCGAVYEDLGRGKLRHYPDNTSLSG